ncbi:hypothetical protein MBLNU457_1391t1 [Dothideomycetes sp. NU457]
MSQTHLVTAEALPSRLYPAANAATTTKLTVFSDDFRVLQLMCHPGFSRYRYSKARMNALNRLLVALRHGIPYEEALFTVNTWFAMEYVEACVQWQRDGRDIDNEMPPLPAQKVSILGFTAAELAMAHKHLLSWRDEGAKPDELPLSVTAIYVLVVEFLRRSLEANKQQNTTEDAETPLDGVEALVRHLANVQELKDGPRLRQLQLQESEQSGTNESSKIALNYRQNIESAIRADIEESLRRRDSLQNTIGSTLDDIE